MDVDAFKIELEKTYDCLADIITLENQEEDGLVYNNVEVTKYSNVKCALSHKNYYPTVQGDIAKPNMIIKLFIDPDLDIPINSKIVITQGNKATTYKSSSVASIFDTHQEILLEISENV